MHRSISYLSKRLVQVRPGEGRKVFLTFLYFCLVIAAYYVIKPASRSLALGDLGSKLIPYGDLVSAIMMGPMVALFARLVDRVEKHRLVSYTFWVVAGSLVVFWQLLGHVNNIWVSAAFYVWVAIFSVLVVTLFWLVANDLFHPREAKRLFGLIGSGGILGAVLGSSLTALGARFIGTEQMLLVSATLLIVCWFVVQRLWRFSIDPAKPSAAPSSPRDPRMSSVLAILRRLSHSRYLLLLVALVGIAKLLATLVYYQFNPFVELMFPDRDAKTAFFALFLGWSNVAAFVVQFFLTSWVLRRLGLTTALLALPTGLLMGSLCLLAHPVLMVAAALEMFDNSMNYSLQQSTKEVLYLPIDRSIRYKIKPFIDMVVFRFGKGFAAVIGIIVLNWWGLPAKMLCVLTIPLLVAWIAMALQLRKDYVTTIRAGLQARVARRHGEGQPAPTEAGAEALEAWVESLATRHDVGEKLALASQLLAMHGARAEDARPLLDALAEYEDGFHDPGALDGEASPAHLILSLSDRGQPIGARRAAARRLAKIDGQATVDGLLGVLTLEDDVTLRHEIIRGLTLLRVRNRQGLEYVGRVVRQQIGVEVRLYSRILLVATLYRHEVAARHAPVPVDRDPSLTLLRMLLEESVQRIFQLLSLLCRPEDVCLVYTQLQEPEAYARADAIELLDNLLDPGLRWLIFPVLDENKFMERLESGADLWSLQSPETCRLLQESIWDHNSWLSVVVLCLVGRLRVEPLLHELDALEQDPGTFLGMGARMARYLSGAEGFRS